LPISIAFISGKGGVGKTTTCASLAGALGERDRRVLAVDMDPQANLTASLGFNPYTLRQSVYDVLTNYATGVRSTLIRTRWPGVSLLAAKPELARLQQVATSMNGHETRLRDVLLDGSELNDPDYILIDTPPNFGYHTRSALAAVDWVVVPVQMSGFAITGLKEVLRLLQSARQELNPSLRLLGLVPTFVDMRTRFSRDIIEGLRDIPDLHVFNSMIAMTVKLQETSLVGVPITIYASDSAAAAAYRKLTDEVIAAVEPSVEPAAGS
jgi:chromosome partitioning protein